MLCFSTYAEDIVEIDDFDVTEEYLQRIHNDLNVVSDIDIPAIKNRSQGPRLAVKQFKFHDFHEHPEQGITRDIIEAKAEELRRQYMGEDEDFAEGYSRQELTELADYLHAIDKSIDKPIDKPIDKQSSGENAIGVEHLEGLLSIIRSHKDRRSITYGELEAITDALTLYYRQQGLFLAQVQLPAQDVKDGIIYLSVQEGILGKTVVTNNKKYTAKLLQRPFKKQLKKPVNSADIEEALYLLNDFPGLDLNSYFEAGDAPGETTLNLSVRDEDAFRFNIRADNHGSRFTGKRRLYLVADWHNPLGIGDELTLGYLNSFSPDNSKLGQFSYSLPVVGVRTWLSFSADYNDFSLADNNANSVIKSLGLHGTNRVFEVSLDHKMTRSRAFNLSLGGSLTDKESDVGSSIVFPDSGEHTQGIELNLSVDALGSKTKMLNVANAKFHYGSFVDDREIGDRKDNDFYIINLQTHSLLFLPVTNLSPRLIVNSRWQYSDQALPGFEQLTLGGPNAVRAFESRDFSADQGVYLGAELFADLPSFLNPRIGNDYLNNILDVGLFVEGAYGSTRISPLQTDNLGDEWAHLAGAGLILKVNWRSWLTSQISFSRAISGDASSSDIDVDDDINTFIDVNLAF